MSGHWGKIGRQLLVTDRFVRRLVMVAVICVGVAVLYGWFGKKALRPAALRQLQQLTGTDVSVESIDFTGRGIVTIRQLVIGPRDNNIYGKPIMTARYVEGHFSLWSMLRFRPRFKRIVINGFIVNSIYDFNIKQWNLSSINIDASSTGKGKPPTIVAEDGILKLYTFKKDYLKPIIVVHGDGWLSPAANLDDIYNFYLGIDDKLGFGGSYFRGTWTVSERSRLVVREGRILMGNSPVFGNAWDIENLACEVEYDCSDIFLNNLEWKMGQNSYAAIQGTISDYAGEGQYELWLDLDNWQLTSESESNSLVYNENSLELVGPGLIKFLDLYKPVGLGGVDVKSVGKLSDLSASMWTGTIQCNNISIRHKKFPYLLENMVGTLHLPESTEEMDIIFDNLYCRHGNVRMALSGEALNVDGKWSYNINLASPNMQLDEDLRKALNKQQQEMWAAFSPKGFAGIDYSISRDMNGNSDRMLKVDLDGIEALYKHFPYPLENISGRVQIEPEKITLDNLVSRYDGDSRMIRLDGTVEDINSESPRFNMVIDANNIPVDSTLHAALSEKQREFYEHFQLDAVADSHITIFPNEVGKRLVEYIARVSIRDASMVYNEFPLPLTEVEVDATLTMDKIILEKMTARNGEGVVNVKGDIWPASDINPTPGFCLLVDANEIELDEKWLCTLPREASEAVAILGPQGKINVLANINVDAPKSDCSQLDIEIECLGNVLNIQNLDYPVEDVRGKVKITRDNILLDNLKMKNIVLGEHLLGILPEDSHRYYEMISPTGRVNLDISRANFARKGEGENRIEFLGDVILKGCAIAQGTAVSGMDGKLSVEMSYSSDQGFLAADAKLDADCMTIKGRTLNDIHSRIVYKPDKKKFTGFDTTASLYGGRVLGDIEIEDLSAAGIQYKCKTIFDGVRIADLVADHPDRVYAANQGYAKGSFNVQGYLGDMDSNLGRLSLKITDMNLAKRSLLGKVVSAIQFNNPTDYIFSDMSVEAFVKGNELVVEEILMSGPSTVLFGRGSLDLQSDEVDLRFNAYGSVVTSNPSFLETLARGLGAAVIQIDVDGNVDSPRIEASMPMFTNPLSILGEEQ